MVDFQHVITRSNGPDSHMIGLGDLLAQQVNGQLQLYSASGMGGGVSLRAPDTDLALRGTVDYGPSTGLPAPRQLLLTQIDGAQVLLAPGQYGDRIDVWQIGVDGSLGPARADAERGHTRRGDGA